MRLSRNQITGILLAIFGVIVLIMVSQFQTEMTASYPGPKLLPLIAAVGLIGLGLGIFFEKDEKDKVKINPEILKRLGILFGLTILYLIGLKYLGFLLSSPIYVFLVTIMFTKATTENNKSKIWHLVIFSIVITLVVYFLYTQAFSLRLPRGKITKF